MEQLERWLIRKSKQGKRLQETSLVDRKTSLSKWKFCVHADKRQMLQNLTHSLQDKPTQDYVLWELASCISSAVKADGFRSNLLFFFALCLLTTQNIVMMLSSLKNMFYVALFNIKNRVRPSKYITKTSTFIDLVP